MLEKESASYALDDEEKRKTNAKKKVSIVLALTNANNNAATNARILQWLRFFA